MSRLSSSRYRVARRAVAALSTMGVASALLAGPAFAVGVYDQFKLVGGSRYVLTVSKQQPIAGVDPAIWPKGYRAVCNITGPGIRFRVNNSFEGDIGQWNANVYIAPKGTANYTLWGGRETYADWFTTIGSLPLVRSTALRLESVLWGRTPANAPLSPRLGGYNLSIVPISAVYLGAWVPFPAAALNATLSVVEGTAAQCPQPPGAAAYFRASA